MKQYDAIVKQNGTAKVSTKIMCLCGHLRKKGKEPLRISQSHCSCQSCTLQWLILKISELIKKNKRILSQGTKISCLFPFFQAKFYWSILNPGRFYLLIRELKKDFLSNWKRFPVFIRISVSICANWIIGDITLEHILKYFLKTAQNLSLRNLYC